MPGSVVRSPGWADSTLQHNMSQRECSLGDPYSITSENEVLMILKTIINFQARTQDFDLGGAFQCIVDFSYSDTAFSSNAIFLLAWTLGK